MKYESLPKLLYDAARSIEMQESAGIRPACKVNTEICRINTLNSRNVGWRLLQIFGSDIEFPLSTLEGKPVWRGDVAYFRGEKHIATTGGWYSETGSHKLAFGVEKSNSYTWTAPEEPKTVMVELPINMARYYAELQNQDISVMREACREALEKAGEK